jgi:hypothetical protein
VYFLVYVFPLSLTEKFSSVLSNYQLLKMTPRHDVSWSASWNTSLIYSLRTRIIIVRMDMKHVIKDASLHIAGWHLKFWKRINAPKLIWYNRTADYGNTVLSGLSTRLQFHETFSGFIFHWLVLFLIFFSISLFLVPRFSYLLDSSLLHFPSNWTGAGVHLCGWTGLEA